MSLGRWIAVSMLTLVVVAGCLVTRSVAEDQIDRPGLVPYTPTRIEWLALTTNSIAQHQLTSENQYTLTIVNESHDTLVIFVRYTADVKREVMNIDIDTARQVIMTTARGYGWDKWVKVRERIELYPPTKK